MLTGLKHHRTERGQSLIVAVIVMFVLFFIGAIFVGIVARNLFNAGRAQDTLGALEFAQAGIRAAEYNLQNSPEGADWRPAPTPAVTFPDPQNPARTVDQDPDKLWLDQGFSRIDYGRGRALIRVTYQPQLAFDPLNPVDTILDPNSKYIKIESIGRAGFLDQNDPTTWLNLPPPRLRRELVAYKAIGLTDYGLFVTNINNEAKFEAEVGIPPMPVAAALQLGGLPVRTFSTPPTPLQNVGFPMRVNGDLKLYSNPLYPAEANPYSSTNPAPSLLLQANRANSEAIFASGKITIADQLRHPLFKDPSTGIGGNIYGSDEVDAAGNQVFNTYFGRVRDGSSVPDVKGYARAIPALPGPHLDSVDPATNVTRYLELSRDSGRWMGPAGNSFNTGRFGAGSGLYIDNFNNTEGETQSTAGIQSLRALWLRQFTATHQLPAPWDGPYYNAPGAYIEFGYPIVQTRDANGNLQPGLSAPRPGFSVFRDLKGDRPFRDPNQNIAPGKMDFVMFIYKPAGQRPVIKLENDFFRKFARETLNLSEAQIDAFWPAFNGIIYGEGNLRTRGLVPSKTNMQIRRASNDPDNLSDQEVRDFCDIPAVTLVSGGGNIYVEGSLVREPYAGQPGSMIALLAQNSVVVNTTLFFRPNDFGFTPLETKDDNSFYYKTIGTSEATGIPFALDFMFGDDPTGYTVSNGSVVLNYLVRQAAYEAEGSTGPSWLEMFVNENSPVAGANPAYLFNANTAPFSLQNPRPWDYPMYQSWNTYNKFEQTNLPLIPKPNNSTYAIFTTPGIKNQIRPAIDSNPPDGGASQPYLFSAGAVSPVDIRIEAVIYAQNGSFFVIPGMPLNMDPADTRDAAHRLALQQGFTGATDMLRPAGTSDYFPFYGEPFDCRVTVVGAISENRTASIADQSTWMALWGYIPEYNGSTGHNPQDPNTKEVLAPDQHVRVTDVGLAVPGTDPRTPQEQAARITRGLRIIYDPYLDAPYAGYQPPSPPGVPTNQPAITKMPGGWARTTAFGTPRQDDYGRPLPPVARMPVCPGFVFYGEVR